MIRMVSRESRMALRYGPEIFFNECHVAGFHGYIRPCADADPDIGSRHGGGIVYAVPHHGHHLMACL